MSKRVNRPMKVEAGVVNLKIPISAPRAIVWKALVKETSQWWPRDFLTSPRTKGFIIEPRLGGWAYEDFGNGEGLMWYQVVGVESPEFILFSGYVAPPHGGPATSLLRLSLKGEGAGETVLEVSDASFGHIGDCDKEAGWRAVFEVGLKRYVELKDY